ncbi:MAG TPA: dihydroorotate dehydrogenase-like protein [Candidatus Dormibacteraeota bacterium]|nr:dihydroorotate dehydrogenase-like protein [Candidatus Dormibacteraeota bacterium]
MTADLRTTYMGIRLENPLVAAASPLTGTLDGLLALEEAGASAVVLQSLFEEQIKHHELKVDSILESFTDSFSEARDFFPALDGYNTGPESYLRLVEQAKESLTIPVIASLNGNSRGGWTRYARLLEEAGADALELNIYLVAADARVTSTEIESRYIDLVSEVAGSISIPLAVKIGPYFSSTANMVMRFAAAGARGCVLFNRFLYPDISLSRMRVVPTLHLSSSEEALMPLRWIAILSGQVSISLAASSGIHTAQDVVKLLLAGADVTMVASALLRRGTAHLRQVISGLGSWLDEHEYRSVAEMKGSMSQMSSPDPGAFERANYIRSLVDFTVASPDPRHFYARRDPIPWD